MPAFLRALLQFLGLVRKYEPLVAEVVHEAAPVVKDAIKAAKKGAK